MRIEANNCIQIFIGFLKSLLNDANMYRKINLPAYIRRVETVDHLCDQLNPPALLTEAITSHSALIGVRIFTKVLYDTDGYRKWKMLDKSWTK